MKNSINSKKSQTRSLATRSNMRNSLVFWSRSRRSRKSTELRLHMHTPSTIRPWRNSRSRIRRYRTYRRRTRKCRTNANINKIYMRLFEVIETYILRIS